MNGPLWQAFDMTGAHPWLFRVFVNDLWARFGGDSLDDFVDFAWEIVLEEGWE